MPGRRQDYLDINPSGSARLVDLLAHTQAVYHSQDGVSRNEYYDYTNPVGQAPRRPRQGNPQNPLDYTGQVDERYTITRSPEPLPFVMRGGMRGGMGGTLGSLASLGIGLVAEVYGSYKLAEHFVPKHKILGTVGIIAGIALLPYIV